MKLEPGRIEMFGLKCGWGARVWHRYHERICWRHTLWLGNGLYLEWFWRPK